MGEHATYRGSTIKIGTCENMYYLRADQRGEIGGYRFALDVDRFRFPFPDEDEIEPGHFGDYSRGWKVPGYVLPPELSGDEHGNIYFRNELGYTLALPCPEQFERDAGGMFTEVPIGDASVRVGRNGFSGGGATVVQQAFRGGHLVTLLHCGSCGAVHRLDTLEDASPVIEAFRTEADRTEWRRVASDWDRERDRWGDSCNYEWEPVHTGKSREHLLQIADRIEAGYFGTLDEGGGNDA